MGKISTTFHRNTTMTCLPWADIPASVHSLEDDNFPLESVTQVQNFCRNPDFLKQSPWCYTTLEGDWALCDIPFCGKSMFSALLALCSGNPSVTGTTQRSRLQQPRPFLYTHFYIHTEGQQCRTLLFCLLSAAEPAEETVKLPVI